ncbi:MAG TPA: hypothetical protein VF533_05670 [Solirubrobacteraceae bacterium]
MSPRDLSTISFRGATADLALRALRFQPVDFIAASAPGTYGPFVGVQVVGPTGVVLRESGLIDSGADASAFPLWTMQWLGIPEDQCVESEFQGAGGSARQWSWKEDLPAVIRRHELSLRANFCDTPLIVLGRSDFFSHFGVYVDEPRRRAYLRVHRSVRRARVAPPAALVG